MFVQVMPPMWQACREGQVAGTIRFDIDPRFVLPTLIAPYLLLSIASGFVTENLGLTMDEIREPFQRTALTIALEGLLSRKETP